MADSKKRFNIKVRYQQDVFFCGFDPGVPRFMIAHGRSCCYVPSGTRSIIVGIQVLVTWSTLSHNRVSSFFAVCPIAVLLSMSNQNKIPCTNRRNKHFFFDSVPRSILPSAFLLLFALLFPPPYSQQHHRRHYYYHQ